MKSQEQNLEETLNRIYGETGLSRQKIRYINAIDAFTQHYGPGPIRIFRAPGRVNLIGEHTDYNHGYVLPIALDKDTLLLARPRLDQQIRLTNIEPTFAPVSFAIEREIELAERGHWSNYIRGAAHALAQMVKHHSVEHPLRGFDTLVVGQAPYGVPVGAGLSSSSALAVVASVALAQRNNWQAPPETFVQLCSDAEWYVGTRGGIMDQFASLFSQRDHALFLDCRPRQDGSYKLDHIALPRDYSVMIVDSGVHHRNVRGEFNQRVAACRAGVGLLRQMDPTITHLRDIEDRAWGEIEELLPREISVGQLQKQGVTLEDIPGLEAETSLRVRACCRHVWSENRRVLAALTALRANEIESLGALLDQAHASARDDYRISCPEIELLVAAAGEVDGVAGARLTGAGWGGCMVALVHQESREEFEKHVSESYQRAMGRLPDIFACRAGPGAGLVAEV